MCKAGCTEKWSITPRNEEKGHDSEVLDLMRDHDLFAVGTLFKPKRKKWGGKVSLIKCIKGKSTSNIIRKIKNVT